MDKDKSVQLESLNINASDYELLEKVFVDPATVITIAQTGKKIYDMFNRKREAPSQELVYLKKIYAEIRDMQNDLNMIINLLYDLKVYIDTTQIQFIANALASKINTSNLILIGWLESGQGDLERQLASIHEAKDLLGFYGFAHIHVYMLAFKKELDLSFWLKKGTSFTNALMQDSYRYFTDALNSSHRLETPAKRLAIVTQSMAQLENNFKAGTFHQDIKTKLPGGGCGSSGFKIMRHTLTVSGNLAQGFSYNIVETLFQLQRPTTEPCHPRGTQDKSQDYANEIEEAIKNVNSKTPNLDKIITEYNKAREIYYHQYIAKMELAATVKTIQDLLVLINQRT